MRRKNKKKAMTMRQDDNDESKSYDELEGEVIKMYFMIIDDEVPKKKKNKNLWFLDSGCSKHITGEFFKFLTFTKELQRICHFWSRC